MRVPASLSDGTKFAQAIRFGINGTIAAGAHFLVLWLNVQVLEIPSVGLANLCAAVAGISVSFVGSRYFVFRSRSSPLALQAYRFVLLYAAVAGIHGLALYMWTDLGGFDYRVGFLIALALQIGLTFFGNQIFVFRR